MGYKRLDQSITLETVNLKSEVFIKHSHIFTKQLIRVMFS